MIAVIEGSKLKTPSDVHSALASALSFPDYYGGNLDALWDCLTGWLEPPVTVVWRDYALSKEAVGEYTDRIVALFQEASEEISGIEIRLE